MNRWSFEACLPASDRANREQPTRRSVAMARRLLFVGTLLTSMLGVCVFFLVMTHRGINVAEWLGLPVFAILFAWVAFSFWSTTIAMLDSVCGERPGGPLLPGEHHSGDAPPERSIRTAVLMPVYNEDPDRTLAGLSAIWRSLKLASVEREVACNSFDFFILSDTRDPDVWLREELAWSRLVHELDLRDRLFYRHRAENLSRKSGNIADFCERWGDAYTYMIVLDADSVLSGETMVELVRRMSENPALGILQVPPVPVGRRSLFARAQQFAASLYGTICVRGFTRWSGCHGNYWGHNAILRIEPFMRHCGLPVLAGKAPLGGEILSHDFVEAAMMLRRGYQVQLAPDLQGSYEECPTTLSDFARRDQRW